jgi:hypothetical protein
MGDLAYASAASAWSSQKVIFIARYSSMAVEISARALPRHDPCHEHFQWEGINLMGLTATGRAMVEALHMNRPLIRAIRDVEAAVGRHRRS